MSILIYDDNEENLKVMENSLQSVGYNIQTSTDIIESIKMVEDSSNIDMLITKFDISYFSLRDYLYILRKLNKDIRIVVLSSSDSSLDEIESIELCVDEYIKKPISTAVFQKRVERVLEKKNRDSFYLIKRDFVTIDTKNYVVRKYDQVKHLSMKEYKILLYLTRNANIVVSRKEIYEYVWGKEYTPSKGRVIDVHISNIRTKLLLDSLYAIRGVGYKLDN